MERTPYTGSVTKKLQRQKGEKTEREEKDREARENFAPLWLTECRRPIEINVLSGWAAGEKGSDWQCVSRVHDG